MSVPAELVSPSSTKTLRGEVDRGQFALFVGVAEMCVSLPPLTHGNTLAYSFSLVSLPRPPPPLHCQCSRLVYPETKATKKGQTDGQTQQLQQTL